MTLAKPQFSKNRAKVPPKAIQIPSSSPPSARSHIGQDHFVVSNLLGALKHLTRIPSLTAGGNSLFELQSQPSARNLTNQDSFDFANLPQPPPPPPPPPPLPKPKPPSTIRLRTHEWDSFPNPQLPLPPPQSDSSLRSQDSFNFPSPPPPLQSGRTPSTGSPGTKPFAVPSSSSPGNISEDSFKLSTKASKRYSSACRKCESSISSNMLGESLYPRIGTNSEEKQGKLSSRDNSWASSRPQVSWSPATKSPLSQKASISTWSESPQSTQAGSYIVEGSPRTPIRPFLRTPSITPDRPTAVSPPRTRIGAQGRPPATGSSDVSFPDISIHSEDDSVFLPGTRQKTPADIPARTPVRTPQRTLPAQPADVPARSPTRTPPRTSPAQSVGRSRGSAVTSSNELSYSYLPAMSYGQDGSVFYHSTPKKSVKDRTPSFRQRQSNSGTPVTPYGDQMKKKIAYVPPQFTPPTPEVPDNYLASSPEPVIKQHIGYVPAPSPATPEEWGPVPRRSPVRYKLAPGYEKSDCCNMERREPFEERAPHGKLATDRFERFGSFKQFMVPIAGRKEPVKLPDHVGKQPPHYQRDPYENQPKVQTPVAEPIHPNARTVPYYMAEPLTAEGLVYKDPAADMKAKKKTLPHYMRPVSPTTHVIEQSSKSSASSRDSPVTSQNITEDDVPTNEGRVYSLTGQTYKSFVSDQSLIFVMFYNSTQQPVPVEDWAKKQFLKTAEGSNKMFASVDCARERDLCVQEGVGSMPLFKLYYHGQLVEAIKDFTKMDSSNVNKYTQVLQTVQ